MDPTPVVAAVNAAYDNTSEGRRNIRSSQAVLAGAGVFVTLWVIALAFLLYYVTSR